jgi:hypothetical protein
VSVELNGFGKVAAERSRDFAAAHELRGAIARMGMMGTRAGAVHHAIDT